MLLFASCHYCHYGLDKARPRGILRTKAAFAPQDTRVDGTVKISERVAPPTSLQNPACHFRGTRLLS
jgi:hypothetical protein